jgi:hypothetical protein
MSTVHQPRGVFFWAQASPLCKISIGTVSRWHIASLMGPYPGRRHDAGIFRESILYNQLEQRARFGKNEKYVLYGDPAYPIQELLLCPFPGRRLTIEQQHFNTRMSSMRQAVKWGFEKIISDFAFLDFKKNQKLLLQSVGIMYKTVMLLTICHTCLYGGQTAKYFSPYRLEM